MDACKYCHHPGIIHDRKYYSVSYMLEYRCTVCPCAYSESYLDYFKQEKVESYASIPWPTQIQQNLEAQQQMYTQPSYKDMLNMLQGSSEQENIQEIAAVLRRNRNRNKPELKDKEK